MSVYQFLVEFFNNLFPQLYLTHENISLVIWELNGPTDEISSELGIIAPTIYSLYYL